MRPKFSKATSATDLPVLEKPTVALALVIYGCWFALIIFHAAIPWPLLALGGGIIIAWHGSLQHETIHGHPSRSSRLNAAIGGIPLSLWLPYAVYRRTHLAHHKTANTTDPFDDPESQYLTDASSPIRYYFARAEQTLLSRILLGPPLRITAFFLAELRRLFREPRAATGEWGPHLAGVAIIFVGLHHVDFPAWKYLLTFVYPGTSLLLIRSFAEHRASDNPDARTATVTKPGLLGLLFLNNNLHAAHHAKPGLPWYKLPAYYRDARAAFTIGPEYRSYWTIIRRFILRPHDNILHPDHGGRRASP
jgi:fatty acid desaturase